MHKIQYIAIQRCDIESSRLIHLRQPQLASLRACAISLGMSSFSFCLAEIGEKKNWKYFILLESWDQSFMASLSRWY